MKKIDVERACAFYWVENEVFPHYCQEVLWEEHVTTVMQIPLELKIELVKEYLEKQCSDWSIYYDINNIPYVKFEK